MCLDRHLPRPRNELHSALARSETIEGATEVRDEVSEVRLIEQAVKVEDLSVVGQSRRR